MVKLISDIWQSLRSLPLWVQLWAFAILVPVNLISILFTDHPYGVIVAILAIGGMAPNAVLMFTRRGFSKTMAVPHLFAWIPLVVLIAVLLTADTDMTTGYTGYLSVLLIVDVVSLAFDIPDTMKWLRYRREGPGARRG
jgi:hypothetical protein